MMANQVEGKMGNLQKIPEVAVTTQLLEAYGIKPQRQQYGERGFTYTETVTYEIPEAMNGDQSIIVEKVTLQVNDVHYVWSGKARNEVLKIKFRYPPYFNVKEDYSCKLIKSRGEMGEPVYPPPDNFRDSSSRLKCYVPATRLATKDERDQLDQLESVLYKLSVAAYEAFMGRLHLSYFLILFFGFRPSLTSD
jgi:hypothetical protein